MRKKLTYRRILSFVLSIAMVASFSAVAFAAEAAETLNPQYTFTGNGLTFEKISHVNTPLEQPDGVVDYAYDGRIAIHDPNAETELVGDRGQSYCYAAASYGDWVYIGTMYGGLSAANIINRAMTEYMDPATAAAMVDAMYSGRIYTGEPDGKNAGGIFFKFNVKTGETVILLSKDTNGIIPTFRSACEMNGKLYFVGMIQDVTLMKGQSSVTLPPAYGIDMLNEAILYQNGIPVIYEIEPSNNADGDILTRIYDCVGGNLDVYKSMVQQNMFTSTRAIGQFRDVLIAGAMNKNGPFLAASTNPSEGQDSFSEILNLNDVISENGTTFGEYVAYKRDGATGGGGIYQVVEFNGNLYVAVVTGHADTMNPETGTMRSFGIIRGEIAPDADPTVKENWKWSVLVGDKEDGAKYTYGISEDRISCVACTLQVYNDHLYIGDYNDVSSALQGFITGKSFLTQATNLEQTLNLYRMDANEDIEMVVGDPNEMFPDGGISGWGSGYETHMSQYHWQTTIYEDKMYLSTMDTTSLLEPIAQFTNGDILEMSKSEWIRQINYIRVLLELMVVSDASTFAANSDTEIDEETAAALVEAAVEAANIRANESSSSTLAFLPGLSSLSNFTLTLEQTRELISEIQAGRIKRGMVSKSLMETLTSINNVLSAMADKLEEKISEEFLNAYLDAMEALEALGDKLPDPIKGMYNLLFSFASTENIKCMLKSLPYLGTSVAGFDLYELEEMEDGSVVIKTVTNNGFGDMNNHGLRVFAETDDYLVIGTANPFYGTQIWRTAGTGEPEPGPGTNPDPGPGTNPDPGPGTNPDPGPGEPDPGPGTNPDPEPEPTPEPVLGPEEICLKDVTCPLAAFDDADPAEWYHNAVHYCITEGLMLGTSPSTFEPNGTMTRAMVWTVLARIAGVDTSVGATWYEAGQLWAIEQGISDGLNPDSAITREQLMTMLWRYMGEPYSLRYVLDRFPDSSEISDYAKGAMSWGISYGILVGDNGNLKPLDDATRAEVATMLYRFCKDVK